MDLDRIAAAAEKLYGPPPTVATLVPTSQEQPQTWRYTTDKPADDWFADDFEAADWQSGPGGFGTEGTPGAVVETNWNSSDIWLRRSFDVDKIPSGQLFLKIHHDEDAEVYVNGQLVSKRRGYRGGYGLIGLEADGPSPLRDGENTLAVHCRQTRGGQFVDVGLVVVSEAKDAKAAR
jgi:hypothetical protein